MNREELERLLSKELDGELTPEETERLAAEIDSDPDAERLAASWRKTGKVLEASTSALGGPSGGVRARVLAGAHAGWGTTGPHGSTELATRLSSSKSEVRGWRFVLAAAAGLVLALGIGFGLGAAFFARQVTAPVRSTGDAASGSTRPGPVADLRMLREALHQTQALMPDRVRWTALCGGKLSLGTNPLPLGRGGDFYFVTYFVERSDLPRPTVCQIAVREGEEATVEWTSGGRWSVSCRPERSGGALRLPTRVTYRPEGPEEGLVLAAEPTISGGERFPLMSSRMGGVAFTVSVAMERATGPREHEGTTL